ncbi:MAG: hypothetical protein AMJ84_13875 [Acidithiobacillales bacterium SM23_46]|nr:MAG: hypothetical protein AMS22_15885 [Thiotrichales bacterium SG8_50]KPK67133.1 MAG: hypothetical protein AMJ84_13875 [Acidithiobacillales bacterium SM23_46]KPL28109.1 MAG: hypothetical protein AMJ72_05135 [Acidithiobacillales bacterium SM1_46]
MRQPFIFFGSLCAGALGAAVMALSSALHAANDAFPPGGDPVSAALRAQLATSTAVCGGAYLDTARLAPFYVIDRAVPLWVTDAGPGARAERLREALDSAGREGLVPANYRFGEIERHWQAPAPAAQACLDLLLTDAIRRYASDVHSGRIDPREADPAWYPRPAPFQPAEALRAAWSEHAFAAFLHDLPPPHMGYQRLREVLARYEALARDGGWTNVAAGASIEPGMRDVRVPVLRARLRAEGDLRGITFGGDRYDERLAAAVRRFQQRHGLTADGIVGARTRAAMNVPVAERLAQIRRTMERWRWLPRSLGDPHVLVNTAGFELDVVDGQRSVLAMRVIVGTPDQATPSFAASMDALVINPYWNVPLRIARDKLLPIQQRNPRFFVDRGFRVYPNGGESPREVDPAGIDWPRVSAEGFPYRLRQEPGARNSMGRVAFVLPNPFDIFLHDTPERWLFERDTRTLSEGCVRIERFMPLALYALRGSEDWNEGRIRAEIESLRHRKVSLPRPIPVYVLYLTSWVDDAGAVHFASDAYQREGVLERYYPASEGS